MIQSYIPYWQIILLALCMTTGCTQERNNVQRGVLNQELYTGLKDVDVLYSKEEE